MKILFVIAVFVISSLHFNSAVFRFKHKNDATFDEINEDKSELPDFGLPFNSEGHLEAHQLLYTSGLCSDDELLHLGLAKFSHTVAPISPDLFSAIFGEDQLPTTCAAVCLQKGSLKGYIARPLSHRIHFSDGKQSIKYWLEPHCFQLEMGVANQGIDPVDVYWINFSGERVKLDGTITHGLKFDDYMNWADSYLMHSFVVVNQKTGRDMGVYNTTDGDTFVVVGETKSPVPAAADFLAHLKDIVEMTVINEWKKSRKVTRTFSGLGFTKMRLPADLWNSLAAYYYNNRNSTIQEEWASKGVHVNWWEAEARMIGMPLHRRVYWQERLQAIAEKWAGVELEATEIYGMRQYQHGARVLTHVKKAATNAISVIVNVAQHGVAVPWVLQIYDFNDRLHEVVMEPGDAVFFESTRCLHGRMKALNGSSYVNMYASFRPRGQGDNWHTQTNPPGTPVPLLQGPGVCTLDQTTAGAFKSCGGAQIKGADDIFQFWVENVQNLQEGIGSVI